MGYKLQVRCNPKEFHRQPPPHHLHFEVILHHLATNLRLSVFSQRSVGGENSRRWMGGKSFGNRTSKGNVFLAHKQKQTETSCGHIFRTSLGVTFFGVTIGGCRNHKIPIENKTTLFWWRPYHTSHHYRISDLRWSNEAPEAKLAIFLAGEDH